MQPIQVPIQRHLLQPREVLSQNVPHRRAADPVGHGPFRKRTDQPVKRHRFAQQTPTLRQARTAENLAHPQAPPHLMPDVHGPGFPCLLQFNPLHIDGDPFCPRLGLSPAPAPPSPLQQSLGSFIGSFQPKLAVQGRLQLVGQGQPFFWGCRGQIAQRANGSLAGSLGSLNRLHQQVVRVLLALVDATGFSDIY